MLNLISWRLRVEAINRGSVLQVPNGPEAKCGWEADKKHPFSLQYAHVEKQENPFFPCATKKLCSLIKEMLTSSKQRYDTKS